MISWLVVRVWLIVQTSKVCGGLKTLRWFKSITSRHFDWLGVRVIYCVGLESRWGLIALRGFESHSNRHFDFWRGAGIGKQASLETKRVNSPCTVGTCPLRHLGVLGQWSTPPDCRSGISRVRIPYTPPSCKTVMAEP